MTTDAVRARGLVLLGCGKMGSAMLAGWLAGGLPASAIWVIEPQPSDWLAGLEGLNLNVGLPPDPAVGIVAVKPQKMGDALPAFRKLPDDTVIVSIAAGTPISAFAESLGGDRPIVRAMPNTPAAIGRGITAVVANDKGQAGLAMAEGLLSAVGQTVRLEDESQMDAVTAVSGSGPAYVFHLIEVMAAAGAAEGLPPELAMRLARATVGGAGQLAEESDESASQLRTNVTSPGGTTAAALDVLMDPDAGFPRLMRRAVAAAATRARELGS